MLLETIWRIGLTLLACSLWAQTACADFDIPETGFNKPEDAALLAQNFINQNDLYGFTSLFPIKEWKDENLFSRFVMNAGPNKKMPFPLLHTFDRSRTTTIVNLNSGFFMSVKKLLGKHYFKDFDVSIDITSEKQARELKNTIEAAMSNPVKINVASKSKADFQTPYNCQEIYKINLTILTRDNVPLGDFAVMLVGRIQGRWRIISAMAG